MHRRELQRKMYELEARSLAQRLTLAALAALWVALAWWLLFASGLETAGGWLGWIGRQGDPLRRACLAAGISIYYVRILFTTFVFLRRGVSWSEVFTIAPWVLGIVLLLAIAGGRNPRALGLAGGVGIVLYLAGSWMNSYAEYQRRRWKQRRENRGRVYTEGLFRLVRHPNYFGDLLLFSGLTLVAGAWITAVIPAMMLAGFVFVNVPVLDSHLGEKYGAAFDEYARRTRKLIPFIY
jgi:steroid 5-alpha reductase family enzyme